MSYTRRNFLKLTAFFSSMPFLLNANEQKKEKSLRFIHITDSHMDLQDSDSIEALQLAVKTINKDYKEIDFVLFGGDNFNNNIPGDKDAKKFHEIISKLHCPAYCVAGNKEVSPKPSNDKQSFNDFFEMFITPKKELFISGKDWALQKNGYIILGLNSNIDHQNNGRYTKETITFAKKMLDQNKPTIILNHHPYLNYWKGTDKKDLHKYVLNNTKEVQQELFSYKNLILTLSGHKHIDNISHINNTLAITTRGFIRALDMDQYPMRYIELSNTKISQKLIYT